MNEDRLVNRQEIPEDIETVTIAVVPKGTPALGEGIAAATAEEGERPAAAVVGTTLDTASVVSIDAENRVVGLQRADGTVLVRRVSDDARLDLVNVGDEVRVRTTAMLAVSVREADAE